MNIIQQINAEQVEALSAKRELPDFTHGDTVKVWVKIREGEKERLQAYEGVVIALNGGGITASFTVRKISYGEGVERVFPLYSPNVASVEVLKRGKVRRAKLYYLRDRRGKSARIFESTNSRTKKIEAGERTAAQAAREAREAEKIAAAEAFAAEQAAKDAEAAAAAKAAEAEAAAAAKAAEAEAAAGNTNFRRPGVDYAKDTWLAVANWYPIYGKMNLFDSTVSQFDIYFLGGAGQVNLSSGTAPTYTAGAGVGVWFTQHLATRLEARWQGYQDRVWDGMETKARNIDQTLLTATVSFLL